MSDSRQYLLDYLAKPDYKFWICSRCGRVMKIGDELPYCAICRYIESHKKERKPPIKTEAGYKLSFLSNIGRDNSIKHSALGFYREGVIHIDIAALKKRDEDYIVKSVCHTMSHEVIHWVLEREHNVIVSKLFDNPWLRLKIDDYPVDIPSKEQIERELDYCADIIKKAKRLNISLD